MFRLFQIIKHSFTSRQFYRDVFFNLRGLQLKYLFYIATITILPVIITYYLYFAKIVNSGEIEEIIEKFPKLVIEHNKLTTEFTPAYEINPDGNKGIIFVTDRNAINTYAKEKYRIIFFPDGMKLRLLNEYQTYKYSQLLGMEDIVVDKALLREGLEMLREYKFLLIFGTLFVFMIFQHLFKIIVEVAIFALITYFFGRALTPGKSIKDYFRLIMFAFYPSLLIGSLAMFIPVSFLGGFEVVESILRVGYAYFALKSIRTA